MGFALLMGVATFAARGAPLTIGDLHERGSGETVNLVESVGGEAVSVRTDVFDDMMGMMSDAIAPQ